MIAHFKFTEDFLNNGVTNGLNKCIDRFANYARIKMFSFARSDAAVPSNMPVVSSCNSGLGTAANTPINTYVSKRP